MKKITNPLGKINISLSGQKMTIVKYNNANDIVVELDDGRQINTTLKNFNEGNVGLEDTFDFIAYLMAESYKKHYGNSSKKDTSAIIDDAIKEGKTFKEINALCKNSKVENENIVFASTNSRKFKSFRSLWI